MIAVDGGLNNGGSPETCTTHEDDMPWRCAPSIDREDVDAGSQIRYRDGNISVHCFLERNSVLNSAWPIDLAKQDLQN